MFDSPNRLAWLAIETVDSRGVFGKFRMLSPNTRKDSSISA